MRKDLVYAARGLLKNPLFTAVAVLSLALGIGGTASVFTVLNAVVVRTLPIERPEQLHAVEVHGADGESTLVSWPVVELASKAMEGAGELFAATRPVSMQVRIAGRTDAAATERSMVELVSGEYFPVLRQRAQIGRLLDVSDNTTVAAHPVAVISDSYWTRRFDRSPDVLGRQITIGGSALTVVGVAAPGFTGPFVAMRNAEVWVPIMMQAAIRYAFNASVTDAADGSQPWTTQPNIAWLRLFVRVPPAEAAAVSNRLTTVVRQEATARVSTDDAERRQRLETQQVHLDEASRGVSTMRGDLTPPLLLLLAMVGVLLAITCGNVAGLLLARGSARGRELAIRVAMGAGRWRVVRQLLVEAVTISLAGGALGLLVAAWGRDALLALGARGADMVTLDVGFDWRVLAFVLVVTIAAGIACGLIPALRSTGGDPTEALKSDSRQVGVGRRSAALGKTLVAAQIAFSLVLLVVAALFMRSMQTLLATDVGYDRQRLLVGRMDVRSLGYSPEERQALYRRVLEHLERLPGVESASVSLNGPLGTSQRSSSLSVEGYTPASGERMLTDEEVVTPGYFATVGLRILDGREFIATDARPDSRTTIVNKSMADRFFPGGSAVGRRWSYGDPIGPESSVIVGVVEDAKYRDIKGTIPNMIYRLADASPDDVLGNLEIRTSGPPSALAPTVRQALLQAEPNLPLFDVVPLDERLNRGIATDRLIAQLLGVFGGLALLLACLGLYGTMTYGITRRRTELGVRMALGADSGRVLRLVVREALGIVALGACLGVPLAIAAGRGMASLLHGVGPVDPASYAAGVGVLFLVATAAACIPAFRASRIDPMVALRGE